MKHFLLLFLLISCASNKTEKLYPFNASDIVNQFAQVCTTSEGKGKIESDGKSFRFDYENILDRKERQWILSLDFILAGEEYVKVEKKSEHISGNLLDRMSGKISKKDLKALKTSLLSIVGSMEVFEQFLVDKPEQLAQSCEFSKDNLRCKKMFKSFEFSATSSKVEFFTHAQSLMLAWRFYAQHQEIEIIGENEFQGQKFTVSLYPKVCVTPKD